MVTRTVYKDGKKVTQIAVEGGWKDYASRPVSYRDIKTDPQAIQALEQPVPTPIHLEGRPVYNEKGERITVSPRTSKVITPVNLSNRMTEQTPQKPTINILRAPNKTDSSMPLYRGDKTVGGVIIEAITSKKDEKYALTSPNVEKSKESIAAGIENTLKSIPLFMVSVAKNPVGTAKASIKGIEFAIKNPLIVAQSITANPEYTVASLATSYAIGRGIQKLRAPEPQVEIKRLVEIRKESIGAGQPNQEMTFGRIKPIYNTEVVSPREAIKIEIPDEINFAYERHAQVIQAQPRGDTLAMNTFDISGRGIFSAKAGMMTPKSEVIVNFMRYNIPKRNFLEMALTKEIAIPIVKESADIEGSIGTLITKGGSHASTMQKMSGMPQVLKSVGVPVSKQLIKGNQGLSSLIAGVAGKGSFLKSIQQPISRTSAKIAVSNIGYMKEIEGSRQQNVVGSLTKSYNIQTGIVRLKQSAITIPKQKSSHTQISQTLQIGAQPQIQPQLLQQIQSNLSMGNAAIRIPRITTRSSSPSKPPKYFIPPFRIENLGLSKMNFKMPSLGRKQVVFKFKSAFGKLLNTKRSKLSYLAKSPKRYTISKRFKINV